MSLQTKSVRGMFGPVTAPDGRGVLDPASVEEKEAGGAERRLVDEQSLPAEYKEAVEADHFVIYGKASVEQVDEDGQVVDISALEDSLSQLLKSGNISRRHKDVRVGEVLPEWDLEGDVAIDVGDETLEFEEGDTLTTGANPEVVADARGGEPEEDEFWLAADIWADSEIAKDTRLRSMSGDLNGFSVTIYAKETDEDGEGNERVTDVDFHAVTIGSDEAIKNKASRYGLAEFKALFTDDAAHGRVAEAATSIAKRTMFEGLLKKSAKETGFNGELLEAAAKASEKAQTDDVDLKQAADEVAADADFKADDVVNTVSVLNTDAKAGGDLEEVLVGVENGDLSSEEALEMLNDAGSPDEPDEELEEGEGGAGAEGKADEEEPEDEIPEEPEEKEGDEDDEPDEDEESFEEKLDKHGVVTEDKLDEKLEEQASAVSEKMSDIVEDSVPDAGAIAEKMDTGSTSDPASGSGADETNYAEQIKEAAGASGGD